MYKKDVAFNNTHELINHRALSKRLTSLESSWDVEAKARDRALNVSELEFHSFTFRLESLKKVWNPLFLSYWLNSNPVI